MKRDFAIRVDSLLGGIRGNLIDVVEYMRHHVNRDDISDEEFKRYTGFIGKAIAETFPISNDLYKQFPDITPDELKPDFNSEED